MIDAAIWTDVSRARAALADLHGGSELRAVDVEYGAVDRLLALDGPTVLDVGDRALVVVGRSRRQLQLLDHAGRIAGVPVTAVAAFVRARAEAKVAPQITALLDAARVTGRDRERARHALTSRRLASIDEPVARAWIADVKDSASPLTAMRARGLGLVAGGAFAASAAAAIVWLACWWGAGRIALDGEASGGWIAGWGLLLASLIPLRVAATAGAGRFVVEAGAWLKQRMLVGALRSAPEDIRRQGIGELMGRILEGETLENAGLGGALETVIGAFELAAAGLVLAHASWPTLLCLVVWSAAIGWALVAWHRQRRGWVDSRRELTLDAVDQMLGYRTRVVQEQPERWHLAEDAALARYLVASRAMDDRIATINGVAWRGWLLLGVLSLAPALIASHADAALALGGMLLAGQALARVGLGAAQLIDARLAWGQLAALANAARTEPVTGVPATPSGRTLEVHDVSVAHAGAIEPILRGIELVARDGERILVEGASGSGKSTLAKAIAGLRSSRSGAVFLGGLDRHTLGDEAWARRVILVPQHHDNHVLSASLGFNLLLGRVWPPRHADLIAAHEVCRELGLEPVLERMPAGLQQQVGEIGWQLSHGERGRVFVARALLQAPDVVLLDETLDALDPETRVMVLKAILARVPIVIAIEHV